eukprot:GEMP01026708.1.p3 GENE.GEMP01026708.1~~GEMP01026708.1.p3  ORF type:complete len:123 (-),score=2.17 GEMP01026708.1:714-1082(-)
MFLGNHADLENNVDFHVFRGVMFVPDTLYALLCQRVDVNKKRQLWYFVRSPILFSICFLYAFLSNRIFMSTNESIYLFFLLSLFIFPFFLLLRFLYTTYVSSLYIFVSGSVIQEDTVTNVVG